MAASREQEPKKRRLEESLEAEPVDTVAVEADRRLAKSVFIERLLRSVARSCTGRGLQNCPEACHYFHSIEDPSTACTENRPVVKICEMLALHEEQVLIYLSESADSFPEETASTYELLEASWFERERSTPVRKRLLTGPCLEFFRRAQRIRDRSGISRGNSSLRCFNSVQDITELEAELAGGEPLDFLLQCIALAEDVCIDNMYCCINSHALLKSFHEEVFHRGRLSPLCVDVYAERFENLSIRGEVPKWCQLRSYLDRPFPSFSSDASELFYANIPCWKLDEALRRVTSHFLNCFAPAKRRCFIEGRQESDLIGPNEVEAAANALSMLLDDGADLELREPHDILHCEQSSLGALVELADMVSTLPIETLVPFICCPLKREEGKVTFDVTRPARLTCLAALKIGTMEECPRVPSQVRLCIRMHQDLKSQLGNEPLRIAVIGRRVLGDSYPIDYSESEDHPGSSGTENWDRKVRTRWMRAEAITQPQIMMRRGHVYIDPANE